MSFRDSLKWVIYDAITSASPNESEIAAADVLSMDEMIAIRKILALHLKRHAVLAPPNATLADVRAESGLPKNVIDWVMDNE